jgi:hypothetical protein
MMRFAKYPGKRISREVTTARIVASERALKRERDKVPLFASEVAAEQPSARERIEKIDIGAQAWLDDRRLRFAALWKASRLKLRTLAVDVALRILAEWQFGYLPGSPEYLADLIHCRLRGDKIGDLLAVRIDLYMRGESVGELFGDQQGRPPRREQIEAIAIRASGRE